MSSIPQRATTLQTVLGLDLEPIGRQSGVIPRLRKFSAEILLKMLVFTLLKTPTPKTKDYAASAAQLGLSLTERAVEKRSTPKLGIFLRGLLERRASASGGRHAGGDPAVGEVHQRPLGDSTTVTLPDACAAEFPGCGGKSDSGRAALKIQVVWDLCNGQLKRLLIAPGRHSDAKSAAVEDTPPAGSLSLWDLGYFCLQRFRQWAAAGAFWIALATGHGGPRPGWATARSAAAVAAAPLGRAARPRSPAGQPGACPLPADRPARAAGGGGSPPPEGV